MSDVRTIGELVDTWTDAEYQTRRALTLLEQARRDLPRREVEYVAALEAEREAWRVLVDARNAARDE